MLYFCVTVPIVAYITLILSLHQHSEFSKTIPRPYALSYNAYTQSVEVLDSYEKMENYTRNLKYDIGVLQNALHRKQTLTEV